MKKILFILVLFFMNISAGNASTYFSYNVAEPFCITKSEETGTVIIPINYEFPNVCDTDVIISEVEMINGNAHYPLADDIPNSCKVKSVSYDKLKNVIIKDNKLLMDITDITEYQYFEYKINECIPKFSVVLECPGDLIEPTAVQYFNRSNQILWTQVYPVFGKKIPVENCEKIFSLYEIEKPIIITEEDGNTDIEESPNKDDKISVDNDKQLNIYLIIINVLLIVIPWGVLLKSRIQKKEEQSLCK
ncbi:MAG: hypothetical protein E7164_02100 [Firmicutes bacterium]|nr:hypothetical protein [Bacillota bacterium]